MILTLIRRDRVDAADALFGTLACDGRAQCLTLERASKPIAPGRYPVLMTVSGRAEAGSLWSPRLDHRLPLIDQVPRRSGLRFHAANEASQLEGCIAPGESRDGDRLVQSRIALIALMAKIQAALHAGETVEIEIEDKT